jgi:cephalosporin hydroxylase
MKDAQFEKINNKKIQLMKDDKKLAKITREWFLQTYKYQYSYHFRWLGLPIIQYPQDIVALQEIIWKIKPDLIIETGVARGGSIILYASMLELIGTGSVLGIDIDIQPHNKTAIENHPLSYRIKLIQGSSIDKKIIKQVKKFAEGKRKILVVLDSNHTHDHVLAELRAYSPLVSKGSYLVVFDTIVEDLPEEYFENRPWGKNDNPRIALRQFLRVNHRFQIDRKITNKLLITAAPDGYLKRVK